MSTPTGRLGARLGVILRDGEQVSPLELFFDLVFVLAITQCTSLMAHRPTWYGIGQALVLLGLLWWSWVGYAWLTSVVDPDDGGARLVVFAAMAALLVSSLAVPRAFDELGLVLALAYGSVRAAHIALFVLASRGDPALRRAVLGLAVSSGIGVAILVVGSQFAGSARLAIWAAALVLDMIGPLFIETSGWRLMPEHFAERHGLILIVALGESIVAIGVGAGDDVDAGVVVAAILGIAIASAFWWTYFDVAAIAVTQRLVGCEDVGERNALARDVYSYLHLPMVAAIVLVALGMKTTLAHENEPLAWEIAAALVGGSSLYLLSHVAFKYRSLQTVSRARLVASLALLPLLPLARVVDAVITVGLVALLLWTLLGFEYLRYRDARRALRDAAHGHSHETRT